MARSIMFIASKKEIDEMMAYIKSKFPDVYYMDRVGHRSFDMDEIKDRSVYISLFSHFNYSAIPPEEQDFFQRWIIDGLSCKLWRGFYEMNGELLINGTMVEVSRDFLYNKQVCKRPDWLDDLYKTMNRWIKKHAVRKYPGRDWYYYALPEGYEIAQRYVCAEMDGNPVENVQIGLREYIEQEMIESYKKHDQNVDSPGDN